MIPQLKSLGAIALLAGAVTAPLAAQRPAATELARAVDSLAKRIVSAGVTPGLGVAIKRR